MKPVPVMVMFVPPVVGPVFGETEVTVGTGGDPTTTDPPESVATQREEVGHEIPVMSFLASMPVVVQADGPPVGFVAIWAIPWVSTATQNGVLEHDTAVKDT
jgi:hypothetical protein